MGTRRSSTPCACKTPAPWRNEDKSIDPTRCGRCGGRIKLAAPTATVAAPVYAETTADDRVVVYVVGGELRLDIPEHNVRGLVLAPDLDRLMELNGILTRAQCAMSDPMSRWVRLDIGADGRVTACQHAAPQKGTAVFTTHTFEQADELIRRLCRKPARRTKAGKGVTNVLKDFKAPLDVAAVKALFLDAWVRL